VDLAHGLEVPMIVDFQKKKAMMFLNSKVFWNKTIQGKKKVLAIILSFHEVIPIAIPRWGPNPIFISHLYPLGPSFVR